MKVSVSILSYNQEEYIAQTLDSVLMQEVNFDYEIIVGDDGSTDNTQKILLDYQRRYPEKIRLILHEKNLGFFGKFNLIHVLKACKGQYLATLDADDYWTDPRKLQKQVDFMESHPECAFCYHRVRIVRENEPSVLEYYPARPQKEIITLADLLERTVIQTCSVMFRRASMGELPPWFYRTIVGDWSLYVLSGERGSIGYLNDAMAAYRILPRGTWSGRKYERQALALVRFYESVDKHLKFRYHDLVGPKILDGWNDLMSMASLDGHSKRARVYSVRYLKVRPRYKHLTAKAKLFLRLYVPPLHSFGKKARSSARLHWNALQLLGNRAKR